MGIPDHFSRVRADVEIIEREVLGGLIAPRVLSGDTRAVLFVALLVGSRLASEFASDDGENGERVERRRCKRPCGNTWKSPVKEGA